MYAIMKNSQELTGQAVENFAKNAMQLVITLTTDGLIVKLTPKR